MTEEMTFKSSMTKAKRHKIKSVHVGNRALSSLPVDPVSELEAKGHAQEDWSTEGGPGEEEREKEYCCNRKLDTAKNFSKALDIENGMVQEILCSGIRNKERGAILKKELTRFGNFNTGIILKCYREILEGL